MKVIAILRQVSCFALIFTAFTSYAQSSLPLGNWRGLFSFADGTEVPFNFEVNGSSFDPIIYLINGDERLPVDHVVFKGDSVIIAIDQFDNELAFRFEGKNKLCGVLRRQDLSGKPLKAVAEFGKAFRFSSSPATPEVDLNGKWDVIYTNSGGVETKTVGVFKQEGSRLTGTFLKTTGDSRFLQGEVSGMKFSLSSFIGIGPNLITGAFLDPNTFEGESKTASSKSRIRGTRNPDAELPNAYSLTHLKQGYKSFNFSLPDAEGRMISMKDEKFKNKPLILTLAGTWCPNCMDEAAFLAPWYRQNKHRGIEVVSIHYERKTDPEYIKKVLGRTREKYGIEYEQLVGGLTDKESIAKSLPALGNFVSFPTTIFIDRKGNVSKIHTGFNGPATGKYYEIFIKEFNKEVEELLGEHL